MIRVLSGGNVTRRILKGDILLPKFQRSFVWKRDQILDLLDSVARGFPIGSVLLWQSRQELRSENRIAGLNIELPRPDYPVNYLLDGQQRLSAICGAMFFDGTDATSQWNIAYDLRTAEFHYLTAVDDPPLHQIRVNKLSDATAFFRHVASLDTLSATDKGQLKARAELLFSRFKDYKIATVTLGDMSINDVAPIFERINSTGTALTIVDLMRAATWSPTFDLIDAIDEILSTLDDKAFGEIDRKVVLRNMSASAGGGFSSDSIDALRNYSSDQLKSVADRTHGAYRRAIDFLVTEIRVPSAQLLPYSNQLTVLADIFSRIERPSAAQLRAIRNWFWSTSLSGYFSGWNTGMMASDLAAVKAFAEGAKAIDVPTNLPREEIWIQRPFRMNNAHSKLFAIILAQHNPVDLLTGQRIDLEHALAWNNSREFHHFFPQEYLKSRSVSSSRINCLANIILLTSASNKEISANPPSLYLEKVRLAADGNLDEWLESNLISREAFDAAKNDDFDRFVHLRAQTVQQAILEKIELTAPPVGEAKSGESR